MAIYDDTIKKHKQNLRDAQIDALVAKSQQYSRENAAARSGAVIDAVQGYDTAYRGLQNMGLAGRQGTELTGEVPRLKKKIEGEFQQTNAALYGAEKNAIDAYGDALAAQTQAAREAQARQLFANNPKVTLNPSMIGGKTIGALGANDPARQLVNIGSVNPQALLSKAETAKASTTQTGDKGKYIGLQTVKAYQQKQAEEALAKQAEAQKALAAMNALGIKNKTDNMPPILSRNQSIGQEVASNVVKTVSDYAQNMSTLRQAAASKDPRAGYAVRYSASKIGNILQSDSISTQEKQSMAIEFLRTGIDEAIAPVAYKAAKDVVAEMYGLSNVPDSEYERIYNDTKPKYSADGTLIVGGAVDRKHAWEKAQSDRAEYEYFADGLVNKIKYAGKKPTKEVNEKERNEIYRYANHLVSQYEKTASITAGGVAKKTHDDNARFGNMTEDELNIYNYLYETEGLEAANAFAKSIIGFINANAALKNEEAYAEFVKEHPVSLNVLRSLVSVGEIAPAADRTARGLYNAFAGTGVPNYIDTNAPAYDTSNFRSAVMSESSSQILGDSPTFWNKLANFAYGTGASMLDSIALRPFAMAGAGFLTDLVFFSSAANDTYKDAMERGATQADALRASTAAGIAESFFEHVSLEVFLKQKGAGAFKYLRNWLAQAGVEGSEEFFTSVANLITDDLFMRELSENNLNRQTYITQYGMTEKEADKQIVRDTIKSLGLDFLGGALSGFAFGASEYVGTKLHNVQNGKFVKQLNADVNFVQASEMIGGDAAKVAEQAKAESKKGEMSDIKAGEVYAAFTEQVSGMAQTEEEAATLSVIAGGEEISAEQADAMVKNAKEVLDKAGYDTSSGDAFLRDYTQRRESAQKSSRTVTEGKLKKVSHESVAGVYKDKGIRSQAPTLPTGVGGVELAEAQRANFKAQSTIKTGRVELQLSMLKTNANVSTEKQLEYARSTMTAQAQRKLSTIEKLADALSMDVVVHDVMTGTSGFYGEDGKIHFALSGRMNVARVAAHELTHQMKADAREHYDIVRNQLIENVGQKKFDALLERKAREYGYSVENKAQRELCDDEVIAELCEGMLSDTDKLESFAERNLDAALALKERLVRILNAIKQAIKGTGEYAKDMFADQETVDKWLTGLDSVLAKVKARQETVEGSIATEAGITTQQQESLLKDIENAKTDAEITKAITQHSVDIIAYDLPGYKADLTAAGVMSASSIDSLFSMMEKVIEKIRMDEKSRRILDFGTELSTAEAIELAKETRAYSPYKSNSDPHYKLALDFSTLCRKRILLQAIQERLQQKLGRSLTQEETVAIRLELQKLQAEGKKIEVACALCYVEAARLKSPKVINEFIADPEKYMRSYMSQNVNDARKDIQAQQKQWKLDHGYKADAPKKAMSNEHKDEYNKHFDAVRKQYQQDAANEKIIADAVKIIREAPASVLSASGLAKLKSSIDAADNALYKAFTRRVTAATRSKAQETDVPYVRGDIAQVSQDIIDAMNEESGFRHQSWSDFQIIHLLDTMAAVIELSQRRAKMHAYSKVPDFVELLGRTGMMINMSLIPDGAIGLDANGNLIFDPVGGMPFDVMLRLRDMFPNTAGNIAIGISEEQIKLLLASNQIDYVIPYHASGLNKTMRGYMDIRAWKEYTSSQNEKSNHRGKAGKAPALREWFNENEAVKAEDGYAYMRKASEKYLQLCYERNLVPKFSQYLTKNANGSYSLNEEYANYWKLLIDRKMVNQNTGKVIEQKAVLPIFDGDFILGNAEKGVVGILDKALMDPAVEDAIAAENEVVEKLSGWQKDKNNADENAIAERKRMRDIAAAVAVQKTVEAGGVTAQFSLDSTGRELSEDQFDSNQAKNVDNLTPTSNPDIRYATDNLGLSVGHYDYSKSFAEQIEDYKAGKFPERDTFILGGTPDIYQKIGLSALPMTMEYGHVSDALHGTRDADHTMSEEFLKSIPDLLKHPIAIIESDSIKDKSVVAIVKGEINGKQVIAPVQIGKTNTVNNIVIDSNHVATMFGKGNAVTKLFADAVEKEANGETAVYYWNKTEALPLLRVTGLQLPIRLSSDGLLHSIFDAGSPVNRKYLEQTETRQFKNWFDKSVVKNADGTPKKVYHGTVSNFTVFERGDIGYHVGTKAQAEDRIAGVKGGHIMELYARIKNPLYAAMDFGDWHGQNVAEMLIETEQFEDFDNRAEIEERLSEIAQMDNQQEADVAMRKYLQSLGYDGIVYENNWEGAGDSFIAFEPVQLKSATDNIGLFDRQNNDIRYAIDTDLLRETVTAIDTEALETKLLSLNDAKSLKGMGIWLKEPSRIFDAIAGGDRELRNNLHEIFEKPHSDATGRYAGNIRKMQARVEQIALDAGALTVNEKGKKTYHEEVSAAIQNYGEGYHMRDCIVNAWVASQDAVHVIAKADGNTLIDKELTLKELRRNFGYANGNYIWDKAFSDADSDALNIDTAPYTLEDLKRDFPDSWKKIVKADEQFREMYEEYINDMNAMLETIYPYAFTERDDTLEKLTDLAERKQNRIAEVEEAIAERLKSLGAIEAEMAGKKRTDTKAYDTLRTRKGKMNEAIADLKELKARYQEDLATLAAKKNYLLDMEKSGDSLNRMHKLQYRQDYYHHFQELGAETNLRNLLFGNRQSDISPAIVGKSEQSKAKGRWAGFFQRRKGDARKADAVNGMLKYGALAEYKLAFDPLVAYIRNAEQQVRDLSDETNRDDLIRFLNNWGNIIAGKRQSFDRTLGEGGVFRTSLSKVVDWLQGRVIANTLNYNVRSSVVQISNIANATSIVTDGKDWINGIRCWAKMSKGDTELADIMDQSNFLKSRMTRVEMYDSGKLANAEKFADWMLSIMDTISVKTTWWAAYNQYMRDPSVGMYRAYDSAIDYADDIARRTHGGRGVGEKADAFNSKFVNFIAPFQLEVNNTWNLMQDNIKHKNAKGIANMMATTFAMNVVFEQLVGSTLLPFDMLRAMWDIILGSIGILGDDDEEDTKDDIGEMGMLSFQRLGAEVLSGVPFSNVVTFLLGEDNIENWFGETDLTRYGSDTLAGGALFGLASDVGSLINWAYSGEQPKWETIISDLASILPPMGGKQLARGAIGAATAIKGYSSTYSGGEEKVQFATDGDLAEVIHAMLFGKWALPEAAEYTGEDRFVQQFAKALGKKDLSASTGNLVRKSEFDSARDIGLTGKEYFQLKNDLKEYSTQDGKRSWIYGMELTAQQKAQLDALLVTSADEVKVSNTIVRTRTMKEDGTWNDWEVKADYGSENLFELSQRGNTAYDKGTKAMSKGADIRNVLRLMNANDAYKEANDKDMTLAEERAWLYENMPDRKQAALLDAYVVSKDSDTDAKVEGTIVYVRSVGKDGKPTVNKKGEESQWRVASDYSSDTWYKLSQMGTSTDTRYQQAVTISKNGGDAKKVLNYYEYVQGYTDKGEDAPAVEERRDWIYNCGGSATERATMDAILTRTSDEVKTKGAIVYTRTKQKDGTWGDWKVVADYSSADWYALSKTSYYDEAQKAYQSMGIPPATSKKFFETFSTLNAKNEKGETVNGLKSKRTWELLNSLSLTKAQKQFLYDLCYKKK